MPSHQQLQTLNKYVDVIHETLLDQIYGLTLDPNRQITYNRGIYIRLYGQLLYEAPKLHTGQVSVRLVERKLKDFTTKYSVEHHHSRQRGGKALVGVIDRSIATNTVPTKDHIRELALHYCQVHYTTPEENTLLRSHQQRCSSEAAYRRANIQLIEARDLFSKKGKHTDEWKAQMIDKYQPIIDRINNPEIVDKPLPVMPLVIN